MAENSQYKWRQRKKRKSLLTAWVIVVIILAALGTFAYEGLKVSNPTNVAKQYLEQEVGVTEYELNAGARSLNEDNMFQQDYTVKYTADGKEEVKTLTLIQQEKKKYGLFEQWAFEQQDAVDTVKVELIAPVHSQVLINGIAPTDSEIKVDTVVSPGMVCYDLTGVPVGAKLQVNGLPFDSYEAVLTKEDGKLDVTKNLAVSENAQIQMTEIAKSMLNEIFTAIVQGESAESLSDLFAQTPNKENLYKALKDNLYDGKELKVSTMTFKEFKPVFGELYYPKEGEEAFLGMEVKLGFTCNYRQIEKQTSDKKSSDKQSSDQQKKENQKATDSEMQAEATFYFKYVDGDCIVTAMEVPSIIS